MHHFSEVAVVVILYPDMMYETSWLYPLVIKSGNEKSTMYILG